MNSRFQIFYNIEGKSELQISAIFQTDAVFESQEGLDLQEKLDEISESLQSASNGPVSTIRKSLALSTKVMKNIDQFKEGINKWLLDI